MKSHNSAALDLPLEQRALLALRSAVRKAIAERKRAGLPSYVWAKGKVAEIRALPTGSQDGKTHTRKSA